MTKRTLDMYPLRTVDPGADDILWIFTGQWSILDNFALTPVTVDIGYGLHKYKTSEHAYAAAKAGDLKTSDMIRKTPNPGASKMLGRSVELRRDWEAIKFDIMWKVLVAKFQQHAKACKVLLETGDRVIYEGNCWEDRIWGVVVHPSDQNLWVGRNALGAMLMEIRTLLHRDAL